MPELLQFDPTGSFQRGRSNALKIQAQEQGISREASAAPIRNQLLQMKLEGAQSAQAQQAKKLERGEAEFGQAETLKKAKLFNQTARALLTIDPSRRGDALLSLKGTFQELGINTDSMNADDLDDESLKQQIAETQGFIGDPDRLNPLQQAQLESTQAGTALTKEKTATSLAERTPKPVEPGQVTPEVQGLQTLIQGLSPELGSKAVSAYKLAGGGDKGVKALTKVIEGGTESEQRQAAPKLLEARFPQASPEEMQQLQSVLATAKNTDAGFKEAAKLREKQRQVKDFENVKTDAVALLEGIIANSEWEDVVGSREGREQADDWLTVFSDDESTVVADIDQVRDMLTVDKLKLMSGVLTDRDIALLANLAGGALNRTRDEQRFETGITELITKLKDTSASSKQPAAEVEVVEGATAHNPITGEKIILVNGEWGVAQ